MSEEIIKFHEKVNHRKNILKDLESIGIIISQSKLKNILKKCITCIKKDKSQYKAGRYIDTERPGEIMAFDLMEAKKNERIIIGIDYFSRKIFGKLVSSKEAEKIMNFIETVYATFPFGKMVTDNGREFENKALAEWVKEKGINHEFSIPYFQ